MNQTEIDGTVVLLSGLTCDARYWQAELDALSDVVDVFVPELRDHDALETMAALALDATRGPLHVVGHSMGGRVAFEIVRAAPGRVRSLAVFDTGTHPATVDEPTQRQVRLDIAAADGMAGLARDWVPMMVHPDRRTDEPLIQAITAMVTGYTVEQYRGQIRALLTRPDARPLLPTIACPTLVACGRADSWSPVDQHVAMAAAIPGARLEIIEDAGHMVSMERPEATVALLTSWLAGTAAGQSKS